MKQTIILLLIVALIPASALARGGDDHGEIAAYAGAARPVMIAQAGVAMTEGEVRKIDKEQGKITLKHGEIRNLDMRPMTMVFRVKDAAMLDQVKEGDKIRFTADKIGGQFTVTGIDGDK